MSNRLTLTWADKFREISKRNGIENLKETFEEFYLYCEKKEKELNDKWEKDLVIRKKNWINDLKKIGLN
jgi:hypothetical protein